MTTTASTKYEDRLRELAERAEPAPWRLETDSAVDTGVESPSRIPRVCSFPEELFNREVALAPEQDDATARLILLQRNAAEQVADVIAAAREYAEIADGVPLLAGEDTERTLRRLGAQKAGAMRKLRAALDALDQAAGKAL